MNKVEARFLEKCTKTSCGCWEWKASVFNSGYGRFSPTRDKSVLAHRWSYSNFIGEIPEKSFVCHSCDNKKCVNPKHLFIGSPKTNMQDKVIKNRQAKGEQIRKLKLNKEQAKEILLSNSTITELAKEYNVSYGVVWGIKRNKSYKWSVL